MSVRVMKLVFDAVFYDITFDHKGKPRKVTAPNATLLALAMADNADDDGIGSFSAVSTLAKKTGLSRDTVIAAIKALKYESVIFYAGISNYGTNNYSINKNLLIEWAKRPHQQREQPKGLVKKASDSGQAIGLPDSQAIGLPAVKPSDLSGQAIGHEPSLNHQLTFGADAPARATKQKKPDLMDGILYYERLAQDKQFQLADRVNAFPPDVQQVLVWFVDVFGLLPSAIPAKPERGNKGGDYALWINELREINDVLEGFGRNAIAAAKEQCKNLSISHPGAIMWALPAVVGNFAQRKFANPPAPIPANDWRKQIRL